MRQLMGRRGRLFVPVEVTFFDDDRIIAAGDGGSLLYLAMMLRTKALGTDGRLTEGQLARLGRPKWKAELKRLLEVEAVLYDTEMDSYFVAAWFSHNDPISLIEARRAADRERKRKGDEYSEAGRHSAGKT